MKKEGRVQVTLSGLSMERLMNELSRRGVKMDQVKRGKHREITAVVSRRNERVLREIAGEKGYQVSKARPVGLLRALRRLLDRWGLAAGAALGIGLVIWGMGFVWAVRVENAGPYEGEVRTYLQELGIRPGTPRSAVSLDGLSDRLEWRFPRIKWARASWEGVTLVVHLDEGTPPPGRETEKGSGDVVAAEDGVILRITTFAGTPQAKPGDLVRAGQVLIKGEEKRGNDKTEPVLAQGEIIARVWVSARVRMEAKETVSQPTGGEAVTRTIDLPFYRWQAGEKPDYAAYDLERTVLPVGGCWVPCVLIRDRYAEAALREEPRKAEELRREGAQAAFLALKQALITDEIVDKWINFSMIEGDNILVTATAEVHRDIGRRPTK